MFHGFVKDIGEQPLPGRAPAEFACPGIGVSLQRVCAHMCARAELSLVFFTLSLFLC